MTGKMIMGLYIFTCRIDSNLLVKLTDTALSRDLFPNDYHCLGDNENRPVKWLAIEALLSKRFSVASEVVGVFFSFHGYLTFYRTDCLEKLC